MPSGSRLWTLLRWAGTGGADHIPSQQIGLRRGRRLGTIKVGRHASASQNYLSNRAGIVGGGSDRRINSARSPLVVGALAILKSNSGRSGLRLTSQRNIDRWGRLAAIGYRITHSYQRVWQTISHVDSLRPIGRCRTGRVIAIAGVAGIGNAVRVNRIGASICARCDVANARFGY